MQHVYKCTQYRNCIWDHQHITEGFLELRHTYCWVYLHFKWMCIITFFTGILWKCGAWTSQRLWDPVSEIPCHWSFTHQDGRFSGPYKHWEVTKASSVLRLLGKKDIRFSDEGEAMAHFLVSGNERKRYICNLFWHWLISWSAIDVKQTHVVHFSKTEYITKMVNVINVLPLREKIDHVFFFYSS